MNIQTPLRDILKTKASYFKKLDAMGLHTLQDLLFYFPRSYEDLSESKRVWELTPGQAVTIRGTLRSFDNRMARNRMQIQTATIMDDMGGEISAAFFNQAYIVEKFPIGIDVIISGKIKQDNYGKLTIQSPKIEKVGADQVHAGKIVAVYPESEVITSKWIREKIQPFIEYTKNIPETLPSDILDQEDLLSLGYAIEQLHNPESFETLEKAKERIAFEELFMLQLSALQQKYNYQKDTETSAFNKQVSHDRDFLDSLVSKIPFSLTGDQTQSVDTVLQDMSRSDPMSRMVQGDVGSGKTIVAFLAAAMALRSGYQVAIMAPTEVLAKQHYKKANEFLRDVYIPSLSEEEREELAQDLFSEASGLQADMLIGSLTAKQKREIKQRIESGDARLIIGTHALVQDDVNFKHLGLVVIDEQHRFGVMQRSQLKQQGQPHILSMTATPIPRSLALTIYGEYDLSVINEKPAGRKEIMTRYIVPEKRIQCYEFCKSEIRKGNQVFVICPLVEQSESLEVTSVLEEYEKLTKEFDGFAVEYLHGKMKSSEKDEIMLRFRNKEFDLLVSTSVIEVGIDIPDATVIIIEGSERFGLSQMHQFRGRVGRNDKQSYCFLMTTDGLSGDNRARIKAMIDHTDGFALSEIDLEQRGPGSVFGVRQSGVPDLQMASLGDVVMIERARNAADVLLQQDMTLSEYPILQNKLKNYQQKNLD